MSQTEQEHTLTHEKYTLPLTEGLSFLTGLNSAQRRWGRLSPAVPPLN